MMHLEAPRRNFVVQSPHDQQFLIDVNKLFLISGLYCEAVVGENVFTMSTVRLLLLLGLLSTSAFAEVNSLMTSALPPAAVPGSEVVAAVTLPDVPLPEERRPLALIFGIALVLVTFQRAFARRQRA
jgi:hypothetical protein